MITASRKNPNMNLIRAGHNCYHRYLRQGFDYLAVVFIFLICAPAFAADTDDTNDPFQEVVAKYRAANPKPGLPEEARKFKVQAEFVLQEKQFDKAVELYGKALDIAPWWPEGHFNRALILGETKNYRDAMSEMKRYLLLSPDAPDARKAQDKIYQWEIVAGTEPTKPSIVLRDCPDCLESIARKYHCTACHAIGKKVVGPAFQAVAVKYKGDAGATEKLITKIANGGSGVWGTARMPPISNVSEADMKELVALILGLAK
jgi:cytochrome c551/c552